jgi:hypothetical protein
MSNARTSLGELWRVWLLYLLHIWHYSARLSTARTAVSLSPPEIEVLRLCALDDWTTTDATMAWAELNSRVNGAAIRAKLYRLGLVSIDDRVTFSGKLELWDADLSSRRMAS